MPTTKFKLPGGNKNIGKLDYNIGHTNGSQHFRLNLILLEEEHRGKGFGKVIMEDVIKKAKGLGCHKIILNVNNPEYSLFSNRDFRQKFFEKFGFEFDREGFGELKL